MQTAEASGIAEPDIVKNGIELFYYVYSAKTSQCREVAVSGKMKWPASNVSKDIKILYGPYRQKLSKVDEV